MKVWRDAASIILAARQPYVRYPIETALQYDYKVLNLKRHRKASTLPSSYVFPGGTVEPSDADLKWKKLFSSFGFKEDSFESLFVRNTDRPIIFKARRNELPREISLRITAIRETFEECGILLCGRTPGKGPLAEWAENLVLSEAQNWQSRIHNDPREFYTMCEDIGCYPNLWALHEWSNWLTPPFAPKRFNTAFFLACTTAQPPASYETQEMEGLMWENPKAMLLPANGYKLAPPQYYELSRIAKFESLNNLLDFAIDRSKKGLHLYMAAKVRLADGEVYLLPGDCMYPENVSLTDRHEIDRSTMTIAEFRDQSPVKNRVEFCTIKLKSYTVDNFENPDGHLTPLRIDSVQITPTKQWFDQ